MLNRNSFGKRLSYLRILSSHEFRETLLHQRSIMLHGSQPFLILAAWSTGPSTSCTSSADCCPIRTQRCPLCPWRKFPVPLRPLCNKTLFSDDPDRFRVSLTPSVLLMLSVRFRVKFLKFKLSSCSNISSPPFSEVIAFERLMLTSADSIDRALRATGNLYLSSPIRPPSRLSPSKSSIFSVASSQVACFY